MGPLAAPGSYTVELSVGGQKLRQPLTLKMDPRLHASNEDLQSLLDLEQKITRGMAVSFDAFHQVASLRAALAERKKDAGMEEAAAALEKKIDAVEEGTRTAPGVGPVNRDLARLANSVQSADVRPGETAIAAVEEKCKSLDAVLTLWGNLNQLEVAAFNTKLQAQKLAPLPTVEVLRKQSGAGASACQPQP